MTPPVAVAAAGSCPEGPKKMVSHRGCACMKPAMSRGVVAIRVRRTVRQAQLCAPPPSSAPRSMRVFDRPGDYVELVHIGPASRSRQAWLWSLAIRLCDHSVSSD